MLVLDLPEQKEKILLFQLLLLLVAGLGQEVPTEALEVAVVGVALARLAVQEILHLQAHHKEMMEEPPPLLIIMALAVVVLVVLVELPMAQRVALVVMEPCQH
jgi:hypothetical protein